MCSPGEALNKLLRGCIAASRGAQMRVYLEDMSCILHSVCLALFPARGFLQRFLRARRVVFCANQVSLCLAVALAQRDFGLVTTTVFYMRDRCDPMAYKNYGVQLIEYSRTRFGWFLIKTLLVRPDEVCVPHMKTGRLIRAYARYARSISVIDDGMDTFRERPKNIVPSHYKNGSTYYTFNYSFHLASWLKKFTIEKLCDLNELSICSRWQIDTQEFHEIIVASPGIDISVLNNVTEPSKVLLVKHSNPTKNSISQARLALVNGSDICLEAVVDRFAGRLTVGESMVLVYALHSTNVKLKINAVLPEESYKNLTCLHELLNNSSRVTLTLTGR